MTRMTRRLEPTITSAMSERVQESPDLFPRATSRDYPELSGPVKKHAACCSGCCRSFVHQPWRNTKSRTALRTRFRLELSIEPGHLYGRECADGSTSPTPGRGASSTC